MRPSATMAILLLPFYSQVALSDGTTADRHSPVSPVYALFDAMREHDGDKLKAQFTDNALLQRAKADGAVNTTEITDFANAISQSSAYLDEHLLSITILTSGNLASIWTPYAFYRDGTLSHCGVNSFQQIKTTDGWKIHYLIDNVYEGDCKTFINVNQQPSTQ